MSNDLRSPLLEEQSVSPPSSPTRLMDEPERYSVLSEAVKKPMSIRLNKKVIVVNYWTEDGLHLVHELEVMPNHRVYDVITLSLHFFIRQHELPNEPEKYLLRFANSKGKAKTDMPRLDISRAVIETNFERFTLVEKAKDDRDKVKLEPVKNLEETLEGTDKQYEEKLESAPEPIKKKNVFCCCFTSD